MNTQIFRCLVILFSLLFVGCASRYQISLDLSNPKTKAEYDKESKKAAKEIQDINNCEAKNAARINHGLLPKYVCRKWGYGYYYPYYNPYPYNRYKYYYYPYSRRYHYYRHHY